MAFIDSLASGLGNFAAGVLGFGSQKSANDTNVKLTRETNEMQKELFNRQLAWQEDMWNKSNAYNDPSKQVERLLRAGVNPAFVLGNGSMAEAGAMSSPSAPSLTAPHIESYNYGQIGSAVASSVNSYYNNKLLDKQASKISAEEKKTDAETMQLTQSMPYYVSHLRQLAAGEGWKADIAKTELAYLQAVNGQRISQVFGDTRLQQAQLKQIAEQTFGYTLQNELAKVQLAYAPKLNEAELSKYYATVNQLKAEISLTLARRDLTMQEKENRIAERVGIIADSNLKGLNYQIQNELKSVTTGLAREELYKAEDERFERPYNFYREHLGEGKRLGTPGAAAATDLYQRYNSRRNTFKSSPYDSPASDTYTGRSHRKR